MGGVVGDFGAHDFDSHVDVEVDVAGEVHRAEAAFAEQGEDFVVEEPVVDVHSLNC